MQKRPTKGPICGVENCRSRTYEESEDGFLYCQNGHRQHGLVRGEDDEDNHMTASRAITRKKRNKEKSGSGAAKHFSGRQGFDLYLKCVQLLLRHQLRFLIQGKGLPAELENVVLDLWILRIAQLGEKLPSDNKDPDSQSSSQTFNTLETEESEVTDNKSGPRDRLRGRDNKLTSSPNLQDCLALCYLGILTLRLPFTPGDIYAWVTDGQLVYKRAISHLPLSMRDRLPHSYHAVLDPNTLLKQKRLYNCILNLQISYEKDHGFKWPALNIPVLLFRFLKELALPLEIYETTTRLGGLLGYDFAVHHNGSKRLAVRDLPEAQLISCLIVSTKLWYPFDDERRHPESNSEPTAVFLNWEQWAQIISASKATQRGDDGRFTTDELSKMQEKDVFSMSLDQMDQYSDFYVDTFLDEAELQRMRDTDDSYAALLDMFPIDGKEPHPPVQVSDEMPLDRILDVVKAIHASMSPVAAVSTEDADANTLRPGQAYQIWKKEEDLPNAAKMFCEEAARLMGLSMDMLIPAVYSTEVKIEQWRRMQTKEKTTT